MGTKTTTAATIVAAVVIVYSNYYLTYSCFLICTEIHL